MCSFFKYGLEVRIGFAFLRCRATARRLLCPSKKGRAGVSQSHQLHDFSRMPLISLLFLAPTFQMRLGLGIGFLKERPLPSQSHVDQKANAHM